ncbi:glycine-rich domain-containing protein [Neisseria iguanae]|uniref:Glycine-rich domain-containing protein-like n=1 Tax=Neisseria iguanae TaxID=90242 RepID=A0A2P7U2S8_9NEIS|nr:glycine-rich domain-containing protein-like [Neisseria iguanae]PSJ81266.1 hypothetical protein C7N83_01620 [Neisseria iguanae]
MDFTNLIEKLCQPDPLVVRAWRIEELNTAIQYYKNFLFLKKKYITVMPIIVPSLEVDKIWHHHILDTRQYHSGCMNIFGYYFHHYPYFGMRSESDRNNLIDCFELSQQLYELEFGQRMKAIWDY